MGEQLGSQAIWAWMRGQLGVHIFGVWALESHNTHFDAFWEFGALESPKMQMLLPSDLGFDGGEQLGVHILGVWALESLQMRAPEQSGL